MAHISGYGGSMTITGGDNSAIVNKIQDWTVNETAQTIEGYAKGEDWKTKFRTVAEWDATVKVLGQDDATDGFLLQLYTGTNISSLIFKATATQTMSATSAHITGCTVEDPMDGPLVVTYAITGDGALTATQS